MTTDKDSDSEQRAERCRAEMFQKANEDWEKLEKERPSKAFSNLGVLSERVRGGDKKAMAELIEIVADTFSVFETLPSEWRTCLAEALTEVADQIKQSQGYRKRGERSETEIREQNLREFPHALSIEIARKVSKLTLEEAIYRISEETEVPEDTIRDHWKRNHVEAKQTLKMINTVFDIIREVCRKD